MLGILKKIIEHKAWEIKRRKAILPLRDLKTKFSKRRQRSGTFASSIFHKDNISIIAEIKPKSPSAGKLINSSSKAIAKLYAKSQADAISVLTDKKYFGGSLELLKSVKALTSKPVLRKDFIIDEYQVYESANAGADAILLIAGILGQTELVKLFRLAKNLRLDVLLEVHNRADLKKALATGAKIIGINNRDLHFMQTHLDTTVKLIRHIPKGKIIVSESGIDSVQDVRLLKRIGVNAVLVGTSILKAKNPISFISNLKV